jgi:hypothetical protein
MQMVFDVLLAIVSVMLILTFITLSHWIRTDHYRLGKLGHYLLEAERDEIGKPLPNGLFYRCLSVSYFIFLYISFFHGFKVLLWWLPDGWGWWSEDGWSFIPYRDLLPYFLGFFGAAGIHGEFKTTLKRIYEKNVAQGMFYTKDI